MSESPASLGYRWPAEWERHRATWVAWPHKEESWPGKLDAVRLAFAELVRALLASEPVALLVRGIEEERAARGALRQAGADLSRLELLRLPTDDAWLRDTGPTFLIREEPPRLAAVGWRYNAWGGKYPPWDLDARVAERIAEVSSARFFPADMVLEGGSVDGDGEGTVLTTESCLLNPNRNPSLGRGEIEERLARFLGARRVLWLAGGIAGDDTDGHVDDVARFVAPGVVVAAVESDPRDENYAVLEENRRRLEAMRDAAGREIEVVPLPMPAPVTWEGERLPASYANFYVANSTVLVPVFGDPCDGAALEILGRLFPGRRPVPVAARDLVWGLGTCHCLTQQEPAAEDSAPGGASEGASGAQSRR